MALQFHSLSGLALVSHPARISDILFYRSHLELDLGVGETHNIYIRGVFQPNYTNQIWPGSYFNRIAIWGACADLSYSHYLQV